MKRVSLELGGKSPVIVLPDADIDTVVGGAAGAIFFNAGQVCAAGSRLYVHRKIFDRVVEGVGGAAQSIRLGPGLDPSTQMGPLVSREQRDRVMGYIKSGRDEGASVVAGGDTPSHPGFYVKPTVMADVNRSMRVVQEEIFGPVLVAQRFDDLDEVAALANDTPYGLERQYLVERFEGGPSAHPEDQGGHRVGEHARAGRCQHAVRRLQAFRYRPRARPCWHRDVHGAEIRVHARVATTQERR